MLKDLYIKQYARITLQASGFLLLYHIRFILMPNTKPPCDNPETIEYIINKAKGTGVEVYPVGCITGGMSGNGLCDYEVLKKAGCICISDDGRPVENAEMMRKALELSKSNGLLVASHCEDLSTQVTFTPLDLAKRIIAVLPSVET